MVEENGVFIRSAWVPIAETEGDRLRKWNEGMYRGERRERVELKIESEEESKTESDKK